jgi:hypothetical protein
LRTNRRNRESRVSKPNSPDNNPSGSSGARESVVPFEQRALALPPQAFAFELTEEFRAAFDKGDAATQLPSAYRLSSWQKEIGGPHWSRIQDEVAEKNRKLLEEHAKRVAEVERLNRTKEENYKKELAEYNDRCKTALLEEERLAQQERDLELRSYVANQARTDLIAAITSQDDRISEAVRYACKRSVEGQSAVEAMSWTFQVFAAVCCLPSQGLLLTVIFAITARGLSKYAIESARCSLAVRLTEWNDKCGGVCRFYLHERQPFGEEGPHVCTPVLLAMDATSRGVDAFGLENHPLGEYQADAFATPTTLAGVCKAALIGVVMLVPLVGVIMNRRLFFKGVVEEDIEKVSSEHLSVKAIQARRREKLGKLLEEQLARPEVIDHLVRRHHAKTESH